MNPLDYQSKKNRRLDISTAPFTSDVFEPKTNSNGQYLGINDGSRGELSPQPYSPTSPGADMRRGFPEASYRRALLSPVKSGPKFHEVFHLKHEGYSDLPASKISELMKLNSFDNAPTQSLLSVANGILDETIERKNGEIPHRVTCLLRKVVQEIERRISTQTEHLRTQNNLFKTREEKYQSRIRVLEALAAGTGEESQVVKNQFQQTQTVKDQFQQLQVAKDKFHQTQVVKDQLQQTQAVKDLMQQTQAVRDPLQRTEVVKDPLQQTQIVKDPLQQTEVVKDKLQQTQVVKDQFQQEETENTKNEEKKAREEQDVVRLMEEKYQINQEISALKQELETARKEHEEHCSKIEMEAKVAKQELEGRLKEVMHLLTESRNRATELEAYSESKDLRWNKKKQNYQKFTEIQLGGLRELRFASQSIKEEVAKTRESYSDDFHHLGIKLKAMADAAENYHAVLAENRKLHNEVQELKGNIRVYCRIRPFLPGQNATQSTVEPVGENGELGVTNPSKQGKDAQRSFRFNKVYGPAATQAQVYSDIQPLIRSVLDGYNVCIFAYGQTGSGKTYTMSGPNGASEEEWGVNFRALNDLFQISQTRRRSFTYEIELQMVEIYNEQVRDLLSSDGPKKLGISSTSNSNGLAVPDASMQTVKSTSDVLELIEIGFNNRAKSATAMNERSSRSHSVVTIHVRGMDMKTGSSLRGSLHLIDLAGSERVDRSEVTGDRLKEAQHINKSLAALGDVIFALAQKNQHVPYRNSKLTQILQSSLGGHAKTLMFVQLNPELNSYLETMSTLKFAERVSGVELGAARSSKDSKDSKELMQQMASLRDTIAKKEEEIERLRQVKDPKNAHPGVISEKRGPISPRPGSSTLSRSSISGSSQRISKPPGEKSSGLVRR
ncbi:kinesin-like protein KIN-14P [Diospyros lotus]|uniref:kinesin-like protein KIN-14P n=1 Tax=Diospyros lotus TaxID=55363 RepID=UPI0022551E9B|nr:kinesin-like protein KIN-14P [Diospyros lotus]